MTTIAMVKCEAGCGTSLRPGGGPYCSRCAQEAADLATQLEAKWQRERQRNRSYGVGADSARMARESLTAPVAGDAERRSALMAKLPRVDAGLERWPPEVCEASDFACILADVPVRERLMIAGVVIGALGLALGTGTLLLMGARAAVGFFLQWSATS